MNICIQPQIDTMNYNIYPKSHLLKIYRNEADQ